MNSDGMGIGWTVCFYQAIRYDGVTVRRIDTHLSATGIISFVVLVFSAE